MSYTPDVWTIVKIGSPQHGTVYKILAGWYGGFAGSDEWRLNSGVDAYELTEDGYVAFIGSSGSVYYCHPNSEKFSGLTASTFKRFEDDSKKMEGVVFEHIAYEDFVKEFSKE